MDQGIPPRGSRTFVVCVSPPPLPTGRRVDTLHHRHAALRPWLLFLPKRWGGVTRQAWRRARRRPGSPFKTRRIPSNIPQPTALSPRSARLPPGRVTGLARPSGPTVGEGSARPGSHGLHHEGQHAKRGGEVFRVGGIKTAASRRRGRWPLAALARGAGDEFAHDLVGLPQGPEHLMADGPRRAGGAFGEIGEREQEGCDAHQHAPVGLDLPTPVHHHPSGEPGAIVGEARGGVERMRGRAGRNSCK